MIGGWTGDRECLDSNVNFTCDVVEFNWHGQTYVIRPTSLDDY